MIFIDGRMSPSDGYYGIKKCNEAVTQREAIALKTGVLRFWEENAMACMFFCGYYRDVILELGVGPVIINRAARVAVEPLPNPKPQEKIATIMAHWYLGNYLLEQSQKDGQSGERYEAASQHFHKAAELLFSDDVWRYLGQIDQNSVKKIASAIKDRTYWVNDMTEAIRTDKLPLRYDDFYSIGNDVLYQIELSDQAARAKKAKNPKLPWPKKLNTAPFLKLLEFRNKYADPKQFNPHMTNPEKLNAWLTETNERLKTAWEYQSGIKEPPKINYMIID